MPFLAKIICKKKRKLRKNLAKKGAKMVGKIEENQSDLFNYQRRLVDILNLEHLLCKLTDLIDWDAIDKTFSDAYCENNGKPSQPIRRMVGLHYLKYTYNLSDEEIVNRWVKIRITNTSVVKRSFYTIFPLIEAP